AARMLIDHGAAIDAQDGGTWGGNGNAPLHEACRHGHREMCAFLIESGADLEKEGRNNWRPLMWAVIRDHLEVAEYLMTQGAVVNHRVRLGGSTPLHIAALFGLIDMAELLLNH